MKSLVSGDELVGESEARHEATLLEPEDGGKGAGEKDALYGGKRDEAGAKANVVVDPLEGPGSLLPHARHSLDGAEEVVALLVVLDVGVNEQGVDLGVDVLNGDLKPVEASVVLVLVLVLNQVSQRERKKRERRRKRYEDRKSERKEKREDGKKRRKEEEEDGRRWKKMEEDGRRRGEERRRDGKKDRRKFDLFCLCCLPFSLTRR